MAAQSPDSRAESTLRQLHGSTPCPPLSPWPPDLSHLKTTVAPIHSEGTAEVRPGHSCDQPPSALAEDHGKDMFIAQQPQALACPNPDSQGKAPNPACLRTLILAGIQGEGASDGQAEGNYRGLGRGEGGLGCVERGPTWAQTSPHHSLSSQTLLFPHTPCPSEATVQDSPSQSITACYSRQGQMRQDRTRVLCASGSRASSPRASRC